MPRLGCEKRALLLGLLIEAKRNLAGNSEERARLVAIGEEAHSIVNDPINTLKYNAKIFLQKSIYRQENRQKFDDEIIALFAADALSNISPSIAKRGS